MAIILSKETTKTVWHRFKEPLDKLLDDLTRPFRTNLGLIENILQISTAVGWLILLVMLLFFRMRFELFVAYSVFSIGAFTYVSGRRIERSRVSNDKRNEFITKDEFTDMHCRIEHNDRELQAIISAVNSKDPFSVCFVQLLGDAKQHENELKYRKIHENFDNYLNWIEGLAILWKRSLIEDTEVLGIWSYYATRLRDYEVDKNGLRSYLEEYWKYSKSDIERFFVARNEVLGKFEYPKDPITGKKIDPIEKPLWFYLNYAPYSFNTLKEFILKCTRLQEEAEKGVNAP